MLDFPRWKVLSIFGFLAVLMALAIPSFFPEDMTKGWPVHPRINLGLDLAGGSYLLLEADTSQLVTDRVNLMSDSVATAMRKAPRIDVGDITTDGGKVSFMLRNVAQLEDARQRLSQMTTGAQMTGQRDWDIQVVDSTRFVITPTKAGVDEAIDSAMSGATEVVRRRIDSLGTREPTIIRQGATRIVVQVPGLQDPTALKELLGKTAKLEFKLVDTTADTAKLAVGQSPIGDQILPYPSAAGRGFPYVGYPANKPPVIAVRRAAIITGQDLTDARVQNDSQTNAPVVAFQFNTEGGKRFARTTQENVNKPFAIILDGSVISAPNIEGPILGGSGVIQGGFTFQSANDLAIQLKSGALPVALKVIEERTVGPNSVRTRSMPVSRRRSSP